MSEYQTPKKKLKFGDSTTPTSSPSSSNTSYTAYIQRVGEVQNSVSGNGNRYFDVTLQIGETDIQAVRVMIAANDTKRQTFVTKMNAQQPISLNNLRKLQSGMVFMHNGTLIKDVSPLSMPFQFVPAAAEPTVKVTDVLKKKQGDMVTVCGTVKWDSQSSKPDNCNKNVRDGKLIDSSGAVDISIWGEEINTIEEGKFYKITNCKIRFFYGKKLSTTPESMITESEEQDISKSLTQPAQTSTVLCCPEIQNVTIDYHAICNNKNCKARINNGGHSKVVRCTSCNRAMLIKNCYMDINTTLQLEKDNKQYTVIAHSRVLDSYFNEDLSLYKDDQDSIIEKVLLLDNVDFTLSSNGRFVVELKDHN